MQAANRPQLVLGVIECFVHTRNTVERPNQLINSIPTELLKGFRIVDVIAKLFDSQALNTPRFIEWRSNRRLWKHLRQVSTPNFGPAAPPQVPLSQPFQDLLRGFKPLNRVETTPPRRCKFPYSIGGSTSRFYMTYIV